MYFINKRVLLKYFKLLDVGGQLGTQGEPSLSFEAKIHGVAEKVEPAALSEAGASLQAGRNRRDSL